MYVEALRGLAALLVFVSHFSQTTGLTRTSTFWNWLDKFGNVGVDIFFVLSGFVIAYSLARNSQRSLAQFLKGRARRLVPIYFLLTSLASMLILASEQLGVASGLPPMDLMHVIASIFFLSQVAGFGFPVVAQGWTLEFEAVFYLTTSATLIFGNFRRSKALGLSLTLAVLGLTVNSLFFEFGLGVMAFLAYETLVKKLGRLRNIVGAFLLGIGALSLSLNLPANMDQRVQSWAVGASLLVLGAALLNTGKLSGTLFYYVGAISYPLYLFQWISIPLTTRVFAFLGVQPGEWTLALTLFVTWLGSHALNKFWDEPIKRKLAAAGW